ncbi:hypothetical protein GY45DRAFT_719169 [Cubamyces sp. BRFM 1775]|nr:hypothetical protein GY45DRAFT_719169 [Cubamyces sp. BRFM 1775]
MTPRYQRNSPAGTSCRNPSYPPIDWHLFPLQFEVYFCSSRSSLSRIAVAELSLLKAGGRRRACSASGDRAPTRSARRFLLCSRGVEASEAIAQSPLSSVSWDAACFDRVQLQQLRMRGECAGPIARRHPVSLILPDGIVPGGSNYTSAPGWMVCGSRRLCGHSPPAVRGSATRRCWLLNVGRALSEAVSRSGRTRPRTTVQLP